MYLLFTRCFVFHIFPFHILQMDVNGILSFPAGRVNVFSNIYAIVINLPYRWRREGHPTGHERGGVPQPVSTRPDGGAGLTHLHHETGQSEWYRYRTGKTVLEAFCP
jgi:hypothetical protein